MATRNPKKTFTNPRKGNDPKISNLTSEQKEDRRRINKLIKVLTTTGLDTLEMKYFEELKGLCLQSDGYMEFAYTILFANLHKDHSQIRLSSLQICDQFLRCSKIFRNKWIEDLTEVFKLVLEGGKKDLCNGNCAPLPPPKCKAELLSQTATFMIKDWYKLYGDKPKYFRLKMGYRHVCAMYKSRHGTNLQDVDIFNPPSTSSSIHLPRQLPLGSSQVNDLAIDQINSFQTQLDGYLDDMTSTITSLDACLSLLLPTPDDFLIDETDPNESTSQPNANNTGSKTHQGKDCGDKARDKTSKESKSKDNSKSNSKEHIKSSNSKQSSSSSSHSKSKSSSSRDNHSKSGSLKGTPSKSSNTKDRHSKEHNSKSSHSRESFKITHHEKSSSKSSNSKGSSSQSSTDKEHSSRLRSSKESSDSRNSKDGSSKCSGSKESSYKSSRLKDFKTIETKEIHSKYTDSKDHSSIINSIKSASSSSNSTNHSSKSNSTKHDPTSNGSKDRPSKSSHCKESSKSSHSTESSSKSSNPRDHSSRSSKSDKHSSKDQASKSSKESNNNSAKSSRDHSTKDCLKSSHSKESSKSKDHHSNSKCSKENSSNSNGSSSTSRSSKQHSSTSRSSKEHHSSSKSSKEHHSFSRRSKHHHSSSSRSSKDHHSAKRSKEHSNSKSTKDFSANFNSMPDLCYSDTCSTRYHNHEHLLNQYTPPEDKPTVPFLFDQEFEERTSKLFDDLLNEWTTEENALRTCPSNGTNSTDQSNDELVPDQMELDDNKPENLDFTEKLSETDKEVQDITEGPNEAVQIPPELIECVIEVTNELNKSKISSLGSQDSIVEDIKDDETNSAEIGNNESKTKDKKIKDDETKTKGKDDETNSTEIENPVEVLESIGTELITAETKSNDIDNKEECMEVDVDGQVTERNVNTGSNEMETDSDKIVVDSNKTNVDSNKIEVDSNEIEVVASKTEVDSNKIEIGSNDIEVDSNKTEANSDKIEGKSNGIEVESNNIEADSNEIEVNSDQTKSNSDKIEEDSNQTEADCNKIDANSNKIAGDSNETNVGVCKIEANSDKIEVDSSEIEADSNKTQPNSDKIEVDSSAIEADSNKTQPNSDKIEVDSNKTEADSTEIKAKADQMEVEVDDESSEEEEVEFNGKHEPGENLREMGILFNTNITITLPSDKIIITESADNSDILENARGSYNLMKKKYLPLLHKWNEAVLRAKQHSGVHSREKLKQYSELRARVTKLIEKYEKIQIVKNKTKPTHEKPVANGTKHELKNGKEISDDEDDDFEEMEEVEFDEVDMLPILQNKTNNNREVDNTVKTIGNTMKSGNAGEGEIKHSVLERKKRKRGQTEWSIGVSEEEIVDPSSGHHHKSLISSLPSKSSTASISPSKSSSTLPQERNAVSRTDFNQTNTDPKPHATGVAKETDRPSQRRDGLESQSKGTSLSNGGTSQSNGGFSQSNSGSSQSYSRSNQSNPGTLRSTAGTSQSYPGSSQSNRGTLQSPPGTSQSPRKGDGESPSSVYEAFSERKRKLLAMAPRLPYDTDLYHWEDETLPVPRLLPNSTEGHRFWSASALDDTGDGIPLAEGSAMYRTRVIEFSGECEPREIRPCHVPLPSGKLCPRRDKVKCPFHGMIYPRDEEGKCINPEDEVRWQRTLEEMRKSQVPDWQDPVLLRQIKAATGVDLTMPKRGERRRRVPGPGLLNITKDNTPAARIRRKIFKPSALRKVATAMNRIDQRKFRDKFGDQFNYT
ncbi:uncharacterized protein LOC103509579 [Diaphorina citri]|uniref:Uncharacterized protein LOC103509579 n=1 Tax=Diaphorina citri TaxID=121845 RepID=A0A1S3D347_DIACI|nr:uncharacterized protein LOC103509579 [Diaphorina citri]